MRSGSAVQTGAQVEAGRSLTTGAGDGWTERRASSSGQSDLLLKVCLCSPGGGVSSGRLDGLVGHDACGELLLGPLKAGTGGTVHHVDLEKMEGG